MTRPPIPLRRSAPGLTALLRRRRHRGGEDDGGSAVLEAVLVVPAVMLIVGLAVVGGRLAIAGQAVESAATDAARAASIARTQGQAATQATAAASSSLTNQNLRCSPQQVSVDTSGFATPVGTPASVRATVTCVVSLADLALPGFPGSRTVTATMISPLDTYRDR